MDFEEVYPENRMHHLLGVIGDDLLRFVTLKLESHDLWYTSYSKMKELLLAANTVSFYFLTTNNLYIFI